MKNIHGKETELRNSCVYSTVRKTALMLEPADVITKLRPGDLFGLLVENVGKISQVRTDISRIRHKSVVSQTPQGDHFPVRIKIFVHKEPPVNEIRLKSIKPFQKLLFFYEKVVSFTYLGLAVAPATWYNKRRKTEAPYPSRVVRKERYQE